MDFSRWTEIQQHPQNPNPSTDPYTQFYNAQQSSYAHYPYYPAHQPQIPNPNAALKHHEIPSTQFEPSPDVSLRPPGIDSYAAVNSYHPPHVGFEAQAAVAYSLQPAQMGALSAATYYQDPNIAHNFAVKEAIRHYGANPVGYVPGTSPTPVFLNNKWINIPLANGAIKRKLKNTKIVQSMRCEVCKIDCNSKDVLDRHLLGKKHKKNLLKREELSNDSTALAIATVPENPRMEKSSSGETSKPLDQQMIMRPSVLAFGEDLETKKRKLMESGTAVDSVIVCTICDVACNSQIVFNYHLNGKRHAAQAGIRPPNGTEPVLPANLNPILRTNPVVRPCISNAMRREPKKTKIVQSAWCEICKIDCNSKDVLDQHKLGKKHKKNLEKLEESKKNANTLAPAAAAPTAKTPVIGLQENPAVQQSRKKPAPSSVPEEDLDTKRRKLMDSGAAADAVKVCTICNVACNSQTVFNFHLAGQKHAAMVKKQAAGTEAPGPQVVTAA